MSTKKQNTQQTDSRAQKRAQFEEQKSKSGGASPLVLIAGLVVVLALIGGTVLMLNRTTPVADAAQIDTGSGQLESYPIGSQGLAVKAATQGHDPYPLVEAQNGVVQLPLSTFDDFKAHYYTYMHLGRPIEFFVLKSRDGVVRAAFNACDVCFSAKLGYSQDGDYMVCNNCGRRFPSNQINVVQGGCNPSPLDRTVEGDSLIIKSDDIIAGQQYF